LMLLRSVRNPVFNWIEAIHRQILLGQAGFEDKVSL
jgi:hypothetical protein